MLISIKGCNILMGVEEIGHFPLPVMFLNYSGHVSLVKRGPGKLASLDLHLASNRVFSIDLARP